MELKKEHERKKKEKQKRSREKEENDRTPSLEMNEDNFDEQDRRNKAKCEPYYNQYLIMNQNLSNRKKSMGYKYMSNLVQHSWKAHKWRKLYLKQLDDEYLLRPKDNDGEEQKYDHRNNNQNNLTRLSCMYGQGGMDREDTNTATNSDIPHIAGSAMIEDDIMNELNVEHFKERDIAEIYDDNPEINTNTMTYTTDDLRQDTESFNSNSNSNSNSTFQSGDATNNRQKVSVHSKSESTIETADIFVHNDEHQKSHSHMHTTQLTPSPMSLSNKSSKSFTRHRNYGLGLKLPVPLHVHNDYEYQSIPSISNPITNNSLSNIKDPKKLKQSILRRKGVSNNNMVEEYDNDNEQRQFSFKPIDKAALLKSQQQSSGQSIISVSIPEDKELSSDNALNDKGHLIKKND